MKVREGKFIHSDVCPFDYRFRTALERDLT